MRSLLLFVVLTCGSGLALAVDPTVDCSGCLSLRDFGNFGAAQIYRASGTLSATVGNDRLWVVNPETGKMAFVDIDTPVDMFYFLGAPIPIPDFTKTEVNATWADGSESATWILPNEIVAAMGESVDVVESDATPEITAAELLQVAGFDDDYVWQFIGLLGGQVPMGLLYNLWSFSVLYEGVSGTPLVTVYECAWSSACQQ
jgi:hypothetical protein